MSGLGLDLGIRMGAMGRRGFADTAYVENMSAVNVSTLSAYGNTITEAPPLRTTNGAKYVIFWSSRVTKDTANTFSEIVLYDTGGTFLSGSNEYFTATTPTRAAGGMCVFTGDGNTHNFRLSGGSNGGGISTFTETSLFVLKLGATDYASMGPASETANSTTPVTMQSHNIAPPSSRDYLLIGYSATGGVSTSAAVLQLFDGATWEAGITSPATGTAQRAPLFLARKINVATTLAVELRKRSTAASTQNFSYSCLVAIDLSRFTDSQVTTLAANSSGTETAYTTAVTQTWTPQAADYLFLGFTQQQRTANTGLMFQKAVDGGADRGETSTEMGHATQIAVRKQTYTATSRTQTLQRKQDNSAPTATMIAGISTIASLCLAGLSS